jgi:hypothetical protein
VITHDHAVAERMARKVEILDGRIVADSGAAAGREPRTRGVAKAPAHARHPACGAPVGDEESS